MPQTLDVLLTGLEAAKGRFGAGAAAKTEVLLNQLGRCSFRDAKPLIRFHEMLLFLRAFPQSASLVPRIERLLNSFHERVEIVRRAGADMSEFDDFDTSGISGTVMQDTLNFEAARWLARRIPRHVEIAWDAYAEDYPAERAMGSTWPRFIPLLAEDADVEANIPWRRWLDAARGRERDLDWLIRQLRRTAGRRPRACGTLRLVASSAALASRESEVFAHPQLDAPAPALLPRRTAYCPEPGLAGHRTCAGPRLASSNSRGAKVNPSCRRFGK